MKNTILEQAKVFARQGKESDLEKAQKILMDYLVENSQNTDAWLLLAMTECKPPFYDHERIIHYVNHVLFYDSSNPYALLFWSYADHYLMGNVDDGLYEKLCLAESKDPKIMAMIEIAKARYFEQRDSKKTEEALKKSIEYDPTIPAHYCMLGELYIQQRKINRGKQLIRLGLANVKKIITPENAGEGDSISMTSFLDEFFTGTVMNFVSYGLLLGLIDNEEAIAEKLKCSFIKIF